MSFGGRRKDEKVEGWKEEKPGKKCGSSRSVVTSWRLWTFYQMYSICFQRILHSFQSQNLTKITENKEQQNSPKKVVLIVSNEILNNSKECGLAANGCFVTYVAVT